MRDPNAPKNRQHPTFYLKELRAGYKQLHPGYSTQEIIRGLGEEWKALSHDKKIKYIEEAELLKKQYLARLAEYKKEKQKETWKMLSMQKSLQKQEVKIPLRGKRQIKILRRLPYCRLLLLS